MSDGCKGKAVLMGKEIGIGSYYDVAVIGGGAVGLAYAIRVKRGNPGLRVVFLEKAENSYRDVIARGHAYQGCCPALPGAGSGRGDGQHGESRDNCWQGDLAPA
jgi:hypothetical protein